MPIISGDVMDALKRHVRIMSDRERFAGCRVNDDGNHIDAVVPLRLGMRHAVVVGRCNDLPQFAGRNGRLRRTEDGRRTGFHFHEYRFRAVTHDDVYFPVPNPEISRKQAIAFVSEK